MPAANDAEDLRQNPDWGLVVGGSMPDGGPRYAETPPDPYAPGARFPAEPWNAATAALFVLVAAAWAWRLRGRFRDFPFLCACLPVLLAGGIGGTLYHATRTSYVLLLLDVVPIMALGFAASVFAAVRHWGWRGVFFVPAAAALYAAVNLLLFHAAGPVGEQTTINISYAALAAVVLVPVGLVLVRTRFRHGGWVVAGLVAFAVAWCFRLIDRQVGYALPMGSHWLWHCFGAAATALLIEFFYRVEGEKRN